MTDLEHGKTRTEEGHAREYAPPALTIIGPLEQITLGSTGKAADMATKKTGTD